MADRKKKLNEAFGEAEVPVESPAPAKPAPAPRPSAPRPTPISPPEPEPFNPPRPARLPEPKNESGRGVATIPETYEAATHPSIQQFWRNLPGNHQHLFSQHPILALHGDALSRRSWEHTAHRSRTVGSSAEVALRLLRPIMEIESQHHSELVDLAKRIASQIWGIPTEMLGGELTGVVDNNVPSDGEFGRAMDIDQTLRDQINKRLTLNALMHGSAVHVMLTGHHCVGKELDKIDPQLLKLYDQVAAGMHESYWRLDIPAIFPHLATSAIGSAKVIWPDSDASKVDAKALIFPVLVQELNKGVAELILLHGLAGMDKETLGVVLDKADDIRHEPYLIQVGPEIWRRLLRVKPHGAPLARFMTALVQQSPKQIHKIIAAVVEESEHAV